MADVDAKIIVKVEAEKQDEKFFLGDAGVLSCELIANSIPGEVTLVVKRKDDGTIETTKKEYIPAGGAFQKTAESTINRMEANAIKILSNDEGEPKIKIVMKGQM